MEKKGLALAGFLMFFFAVYVIGNDETSTTTTSVAVAPTATPEPTIIPPTTVPNMDDELNDIRSESNVVSVNIEDLEEGKHIIVTRRVNDFLTVGLFTDGASSIAFEFFERLFNYPEVTMVTVETLSEFTDVYGQKSEDKAFSFTLDRTTADKISWENVSKKYESLLRIADVAYTHPAILNELNK